MGKEEWQTGYNSSAQNEKEIAVTGYSAQLPFGFHFSIDNEVWILICFAERERDFQELDRRSLWGCMANRPTIPPIRSKSKSSKKSSP
jgi:hypothetical protein